MNDRLSDYADKGEVMKVVAICLVILPLCACWTTGNGEKVGTIIKVADEGMFSTTHEFEIVRGGMAGGAGSFSITPACITVEEGNPQLEAIRDAFNKQIEVVVNYRQGA